MIDQSMPASDRFPMGVAVCGTIITPGLLVWTNEFKIGRVGAAHPHSPGWFDVHYPDGGSTMQNAERVVTRFQGRLASVEAYTHAIHFGMYPKDQPGLPMVTVEEHFDPTHEDILSTNVLPPHLHGVVSGSWGCWGPADQLTDGDLSLHVQVGVDWFDDLLIGEIYQRLAKVTEGVLLQWGTVTQWQDTSEQTHMWAYNPSTDHIELKETC